TARPRRSLWRPHPKGTRSRRSRRGADATREGARLDGGCMSAAAAELYSEGMIRGEDGIWREVEGYSPAEQDDIEARAEEAEALTTNDWQPEPGPAPTTDTYADYPPEARRLHERESELLDL